jgi:uroporphyrinogen decarboxylase
MYGIKKGIIIEFRGKKMTSRERILTALNKGQPDQVPIFELYINEPNIVDIARIIEPESVKIQAGKDKFGDESLAVLDLYCMIINKLEIDATCTNFSIGISNISDDRGIDKYGTVYVLSDHGEPTPIDGPIKSRDDLIGFDPASKITHDDFAKVKYVIDKLGKEKAHFVSVTDPFKSSWRWRGGMQNLLMDYATDPQMVHELANIASDFDNTAIDMIASLGADVITVPGDLAGEYATIMSPQHYREFIKPYHQRLVQHAHDKGLKIIKHSDGNLWSIMDDLLEVGFDGIHPIQPQCMDIGEVKAYMKGKACVLGNIDCRDLLVNGTPKEVTKTVIDTIHKSAHDGGYIISSSNSIHPGCKSENYLAMVSATKKYGKYPIV